MCVSLCVCVPWAQLLNCIWLLRLHRSSLMAQMLKSLACNVGDLGSIPGPGTSPGGGNDNPLQHSCLENSMDRGAWRASLWGHKELNMTEWLTFSPSLMAPWTVAHHALLSMGFPRQEHWNGLLFPPPGDLPNPGIELFSFLHWQPDS